MLLDAVVDYLPSPIDVPDITGVNPDTGEEELLGLIRVYRAKAQRRMGAAPQLSYRPEEAGPEKADGAFLI